MKRTHVNRKSLEGTVNINVPIHAEVHAQMKAAASLEGLSMQEWLESLLRETLMIGKSTRRKSEAVASR